MRLSFEALENRELFDAAPIYGPMPLETSAPDAAEVAACDVPQAIDLSSLVGPVPEALVMATTSARAIHSQDVVIVEASDLAPDQPTFVQFGEYNTANKRLETSWVGSDRALGYAVQYSTDGTTWKVAGYTLEPKFEREARGVEPDRVYFYRVAAFNEFGQSAWTEGTWEYSYFNRPSEPGAISFDGYDASTGKLTYSWGFSESDDVAYYPCEYSYDGLTWKSAGNVKGNRNYRTASGVSENATVWFRVCAKDVDGLCSPWVYACWTGDLS